MRQGDYPEKAYDAFGVLSQGVDAVLHIDEIAETIDICHTDKTPARVAKAYMELFEGCFQKPEDVLQTSFADKVYDEMVFINEINFVSVCAHHWFPFFGRVHFAYIPDRSIVGLSKVPRMVNILAKRPQVQEKLVVEIVDTFMEHVKPKGCAAVIEAYHLCMSIRGAKSNGYTKTHALRGVFMDNSTVRQEFMDGINHNGKKQLWP